MTHTIIVSDETYEAIKGQLNGDEINAETYDDLIGKKLFLRGVTYHLVGRVRARLGQFLELESASWVASSGRFMQAIRDGKLDEVEPVGQAWINLQAVVDFFPWRHDLPTQQK